MTTPKITEESRDFLVVWQWDGPVIQSKVSTYLDPDTLDNKRWVYLAALTEGCDPEEIGSWDVFLVIPYPEKFYV